MTHTPNHHSDALIDDMTLAIVDEVRRDARISVSALAHKLGISRSFASSRLNALSEAGIIRRYTVDIDPHALGKKVTALVFVSLDQSAWDDFLQRLHTVPELDYCAITTGAYDVLLRIRSEDVQGVQRCVIRTISQWPCVKDTQTEFLMSEQVFDFSLVDHNRVSHAHEPRDV